MNAKMMPEIIRLAAREELDLMLKVQETIVDGRGCQQEDRFAVEQIEKPPVT